MKIGLSLKRMWSVCCYSATTCCKYNSAVIHGVIKANMNSLIKNFQKADSIKKWSALFESVWILLWKLNHSKCSLVAQANQRKCKLKTSKWYVVFDRITEFTEKYVVFPSNLDCFGVSRWYQFKTTRVDLGEPVLRCKHGK